jgi:mannan endo-1,4-beta-mannosidase
MRRLLRGSIRLAPLAAWLSASLAGAAPLAFVERQGDRLVEGGRELRFLSFNIPNLHYVEDDLRFAQPVPFRWPTEYEIEDALESTRQAGGTVVRIYALSVRKADDPEGMPRHVLGPGRFDEEGFRVLDTVLDLAGRKGIRLVIPLVDNWKWWGGVAEYAAFRGKGREEFWSDPELIGDFQATIRFVLTRKNTRTGIVYRDDPAVLAWETGNELSSPQTWTHAIAGLIRQIDPRHLVLDGTQAAVLRQEQVDDPAVDLVQTHHYEKDPRQMIAHIRKSAAMAHGRKPYLVGEVGFLPTGGMTGVLDTILDEGIAGGLVWSLRGHDRDGGFYWHQEPYGGDLFKAYHWPGFAEGEAYDETRFLQALRERAFRIRGLEAEAPVPPAAPVLLEVTSGGLVTWRGSAGASGYDVERAVSGAGPWVTVGYDVSDARVQYRPLFSDETALPGRSYHYRVRARNPAGTSPPSPALGPIAITHRTLVDELWNEGCFFFREGGLSLRTGEARRFKEDAHRLAGEPGATVVYRAEGPIDQVRLYAFAESDGPHLELATSADGERFEPASAERQALSAGDADTYGYRVPILFRLETPRGPRFVRVAFRGPVELSRVEIEYHLR